LSGLYAWSIKEHLAFFTKPTSFHTALYAAFSQGPSKAFIFPPDPEITIRFFTSTIQPFYIVPFSTTIWPYIGTDPSSIG
jgi:hypothetical protein